MKHLVTIAALAMSFAIVVTVGAQELAAQRDEKAQPAPVEAEAMPCPYLLGVDALAGPGGTFQCRNNGGCVARRSVNGELESVNFRKGDYVSTDDGWIVDPDDGWRKVKVRKGACFECHD